MVKHVSIRFSWHDDEWDGGICKDPERNIYCTGNYSLLSPRIQRRIKLDTEDHYKNQKISKLSKEQKYVPPCYWCLNALGTEGYLVEDRHPFADTGEEFKEVPPLKYNLKGFSVCSWNFKLGYSEKGSFERYIPPKELEKRTEEYLDDITKGRSIAFFYANYSNPLTGEDRDRKYLLLGAGLVRDVKKPQEYGISDELIERVRSRPHMKNTPKLAWQFQVTLEPSSVFVLPYQDYLDLIDQQDEDEAITTWKKLDEVTTRIEDRTIIPHFKYVSMHLPHDKAIYLLYLFRQSIRKMKEHKLAEYSVIEEAEKKIDRLIAIAWKQRGKYPGFRNVLFVMLRNDFDREYLKELIPRIEKHIRQNFGSIESFFEKTKGERKKAKVSSDILRALRIVNGKKDSLKFLSLFDFSIKQFENVEEIVNKFGLETVKNNPYILLENYNYDVQDSWNIDESDYGIGLYQIDIALIPDPKYVDWEAPYDVHARSPERLRALVSKILYDVAINQGNSCVTREEIVELIQKYPLYYINERLRVDNKVLSEYEKQVIFKEKFLTKEDIQKNQVIYQLKVIRDVENIIEQFVQKMLRKLHAVDIKEVEEIVKKEVEQFKEKLDVDERTSLYSNSLKNGLFVLTGKAGSGKTHAVVNLIAKFMENRKLPVFVFTPTGKANLVIRNRLKKLKLHKETRFLRVSTIHRFLYRALFDFYLGYTFRKRDVFKLRELVSKLLSGKLEFLSDFRSSVKGWEFNPKVVIVDEASMVDEVLLAVLFSFINPNVLEHLILVGDEKQLPPIGIGRPFADLIFYLKRKGLEINFIHLESNLRFDPSKSLGMFSELFSGQEQPSPIEIEGVLESHDVSLEANYFSNTTELKTVMEQILSQIGCKDIDKSLFEMFTDVFESEEPPNLDKVQIITPRRVGDFGSVAINRNVVLDRVFDYAPKTKLICEENIYFNTRGGRALGLANGSIGYIKNYGYVYFEDISELFEDYSRDDVMGLVRKVGADVYRPGETERKIDFGYAITVHKAQGSDFEHVILVLSQMSPFITRELVYTALTRPREKLHLVVHSELKDELPLVLAKVYSNSSVEQRRTLLFGHKTSPFKPYEVTLKDKRTIEVDSKIERIIAQVLDKLDIEFEHGPKEFLAEYHVVPDFKLRINDKDYYLEHLGRMDNLGYRERWLRKFETYKKLGIADVMITTTESEEKSDVEKNIKRIIDDIKSNKLRQTEGYSYHHYEI